MCMENPGVMSKKKKKKSLNCFSNLLVFLCHFKCMDVFAVTSLTNWEKKKKKITFSNTIVMAQPFILMSELERIFKLLLPQVLKLKIMFSRVGVCSNYHLHSDNYVQFFMSSLNKTFWCISCLMWLGIYLFSKMIICVRHVDKELHSLFSLFRSC